MQMWTKKLVKVPYKVKTVGRNITIDVIFPSNMTSFGRFRPNVVTLLPAVCMCVNKR